MATLDRRGGPLGRSPSPTGARPGPGQGTRPRVAGRVVAVAVDPGDPRHLLAGGGGVWESRDGGRTWTPRSDDQPTAAVGAVAFAPGDPAVAYAGTGQGEALAALGVGLLRSGDGGASWRALVAKELLGAGFHDLLVDPEDPDRLLAATTAGLWASADGGLGWEPRLGGRSWSVSHGASGELLAGGEFGLHRSEDGGATWQRVPLASAPGGFDRVAVAHDPGGQVTYVFAAGDGVGHLWRRDHPGGPFDFDPVKPPADLDSRRAWHSWACAADPGDPGVVWLGAAGLHRGARARDGRWSWVDLAARPAGDSLPAGQHAVVFEPGDPLAVYVANEGGLFRSPDGGRSWRSLVTGLAVAEVDRLADHAAWLLAGAGELGALRYEGGEVWCPVGTGDPALLAGDELVTPGPGGLAVSADGGSTWTAAPLPGVGAAVTALAAVRPGPPARRHHRRRTAPRWSGPGTPGRWPERPALGRVAWPGSPSTRPGRRSRGRPGRITNLVGPAPGGRGHVLRRPQRRAGPATGGRGRDPTSAAGGCGGPGTGVRPGTTGAVGCRRCRWGRSWPTRSGRGRWSWPPMPGCGGQRTTGPAGARSAPGCRTPRRLPSPCAGPSGCSGSVCWAGASGSSRWTPAPPSEAATPALRSGRSPAARPRPGGPWWECPDIKLEVPPRPREEPVTPVEFEDDRWPGATGLPELGGRVMPDRLARVHVQVHHRGDGPLRDVQVRVLAVPACLRPPDLPTGDWVLGGAPPAGSPWRPVGPPAAIGDLHPGRSAVASFDWQVPWDLPPHVCLLALAATGGPPARTRPGRAGGRGAGTAARRRELPRGRTDSLRCGRRPGRPGGGWRGMGAEESHRGGAGSGTGAHARPARLCRAGAVHACGRRVGGGAGRRAGSAEAVGGAGQGGGAGGGAGR